MEEKERKLISSRTGILIAPEKKKKQKEDERFLMISFALLEDDEFRKENANPFMLLSWLCKFVVRAPMRADKLNLFEDYYKNDTLACGLTQARLARDMGVSKRTIMRWLDYLERKEVLRIDKVPIDKYKKQNVYVVGTHNGYSACYFMHEIYTK